MKDEHKEMDLYSLKEIFNNDTELYTAVEFAFKKLYLHDIYLINNAPLKEYKSDEKQLGKHYVGERAIVFRFAHYLQSEISGSKKYYHYDLDCEYNRNLYEPKLLPSFVNGVFPDMIIHKRSTNQNNLLVMEFKTYWNNSKAKIASDLLKIKEFKNEPYNYKYGAVVIIGKTIDKLRFII